MRLSVVGEKVQSAPPPAEYTSAGLMHPVMAAIMGRFSNTIHYFQTGANTPPLGEFL